MDGIATILHFRYTHTRYNREGEVIADDTGTLKGYTPKAVKLALVKRFHLQAWSSWTHLPNGKYQRIHIWTPERPYRGSITLKPILGTDRT